MLPNLPPISFFIFDLKTDSGQIRKKIGLDIVSQKVQQYDDKDSHNSAYGR